MKFETASATAAEKKRDRAKNIQAARDAIRQSQRQEAALSSLVKTYQKKYPDVFKDRYPRGVNTNRHDKDKMISQLKAEMSELEIDYVPVKKRFAQYEYGSVGGEKTVLNRTFNTKTGQAGPDRKRKTGNFDPEAALNEKSSPEGEKAVAAVDKMVKTNGGMAVLGDAFKMALKAGVTYLTGGSPYIADIAVEGLTALWYQRKNIAEGWRKMKSWFGGLKKKRLSLETVADNIDRLANVPIKSVPEFDKTFLKFGLRKTIVDLLKANSEVAKLLFENPTKENLLALLQKYNGNTLPPGTAEACQTLLTKDHEIRNILDEAGGAKKNLETATYSFKEALDRGDLVSANGALVPVASTGITCDGYGGAPGPAVIQGFTDEMIMNTELYKRLYEEYAKSRNQAEESRLAAEQLEKERGALTLAFNNKLAEEIRRRVDETAAMYEERLKLKETELDAKTTQYNQASESLALVRAGLKNAEADRDGFEKQFREATAKNTQLTLDLQSLSAKGEQQFEMIQGLKNTIEDYKKSASVFQGIADEYKLKLQEMTKEKEGALVALKENNQLVVVEKDNRIKTLMDKIRDLSDQVNTQKALVAQGKKMLDDKAKEIITLQAQGAADNNALTISFTEERKRIAAERERLEASNADLERQIVALQQESSVLTTESNNYKTKIEQLQAQVDAGHELQGKLENVNASFKNRIATLEGLVEKHQADNDALQGQLADLLQADADNKEALAKKSREYILLKEEKDAALLGAAAKYQGMEQGYAKELEAANKKIKELSDKQEQYKKELENEKWWWSIFQDKDKIRTLEENIVSVETQKIATGMTADIARANLWKAMRGDYEGMIKRVAGSTGGAYLVGSAPDWNLQPNERIQQFWSKFYDLSFHPY